MPPELCRSFADVDDEDDVDVELLELLVVSTSYPNSLNTSTYIATISNVAITTNSHLSPQ
jgi:hypothetical protein